MKVAALDLGSNTFLMLVADVKNGRVGRVYRDELRVTRLGQGVNANKALHPEALARAEECFKQYAEIIAVEKPDKVLAMATSAARDAKNASALFQLGEKYKIPIQIIPGEKEAEITFSGACSDRGDAKACAVIDVGGGSTEIVFQAPTGRLVGASLDVGSVRLTEMFVTGHPVDKSEIEKISQYVRGQIEKKKLEDLSVDHVQNIICVAGTPTTLAAVAQEKDYSTELVHGFRLPLSNLKAWRDRLAAMDLEARKSLRGMDSKRADVIVAGATILLETANVFKKSEIVVSDRGVRFGVAIYMGGM